MCIVLLLESIANLGWILNSKFRPLNFSIIRLRSLSAKIDELKYLLFCVEFN